MKKIYFGNFILSIFILALFTSCEQDISNSTGWAYNDPGNGGYDVSVDFIEQETGPGLVFVEGGTFSMGRVEQDVVYDWNNVPKRVTVSSFYMDQWEVRNVDYREYLYWIQRIYTDYPEIYWQALPDTLIWLEKKEYNDPYVELYFRHPAYRDYPVVGVTWKQATEYAKWRTDRVNEMILIKEGILQWDPVNQNGEENFDYDSYIAGQYEGLVDEGSQGLLPDLDPNKEGRKVRIEDGIFLPRYRLPTEAEWEFAAVSLIGNHVDERIYERRLFPWNGHFIRNADANEEGVQGQIMANMMRGRGDHMGVAGALNDVGDITMPVYSYWPNDYGLYCMAGNVNEWVMDVYRPTSIENGSDFRPFRGNVYKTQQRDAERVILEKDTLGRVPIRKLTDEESYSRRNFNTADNINFEDGDFTSSIPAGVDWKEQSSEEKKLGSRKMYEFGEWKLDGPLNERKKGVLENGNLRSLINDEARVYKGGSWRDRVFWMIPGTRRFLDQNQCRSDLGFRCAMFRAGSSIAAY